MKPLTLVKRGSRQRWYVRVKIGLGGGVLGKIMEIEVHEMCKLKLVEEDVYDRVRRRALIESQPTNLVKTNRNEKSKVKKCKMYQIFLGRLMRCAYTVQKSVVVYLF